MTCTSPTLRHMSRIYLDLKSIHCQTISGLNPNQLDRPVQTMGSKTTVSQRPIVCLLCCIMSSLKLPAALGFVTPTPISPPTRLPLPEDHAVQCEISC